MRYLVLLVVTGSLSACSVGWSFGDGIAFAGSPEGIEAFYDGQNGLIANGKTSDPLGDSASWQHRKLQEQEKTKRIVPQSFWGKLTNANKGS